MKDIIDRLRAPPLFGKSAIMQEASTHIEVLHQVKDELSAMLFHIALSAGRRPAYEVSSFAWRALGADEMADAAMRVGRQDAGLEAAD